MVEGSCVKLDIEASGEGVLVLILTAFADTKPSDQ